MIARVFDTGMSTYAAPAGIVTGAAAAADGPLDIEPKSLLVIAPYSPLPWPSKRNCWASAKRFAIGLAYTRGPRCSTAVIGRGPDGGGGGVGAAAIGGGVGVGGAAAGAAAAAGFAAGPPENNFEISFSCLSQGKSKQPTSIFEILKRCNIRFIFYNDAHQLTDGYIFLSSLH